MPIETDYEDARPGPNYPRMIKVALASILYLASLGIIVASQSETIDRIGEAMNLVLVLGSSIVLLTITFLWMRELGLGSKQNEPLAASTRKSHWVLIWSALLGAVIALSFYFLQFGQADDLELFSNGPVVPAVAILLCVVYAVGLIYTSYLWDRSTDEHERAAVITGIYAAIGFYLVATPVWWMLQRAGLLPEQDPMIMFALVMTIMSAAWTYKRGA